MASAGLCWPLIWPLIVSTRPQGFDEAELRAAGYFGVNHSEAAEEPSFEDAFGALEGGIGLFDALPYDEPHGWLMSVMRTDCDGLRDGLPYDDS